MILLIYYLLGVTTAWIIHTHPTPLSNNFMSLTNRRTPLRWGVLFRRKEKILNARTPLTEDQVGRLRHMLNNDYSYRAMAKHFDVCTDTLKRMLVREGLAEFDGAKYAVSPYLKNQDQIWQRPCIRCKDKTPRAKWQYICERCKSSVDVSGLPDSFIEAFSDGDYD